MDGFQILVKRVNKLLTPDHPSLFYCTKYLEKSSSCSCVHNISLDLYRSKVCIESQLQSCRESTPEPHHRDIPVYNQFQVLRTRTLNVLGRIVMDGTGSLAEGSFPGMDSNEKVPKIPATNMTNVSQAIVSPMHFRLPEFTEKMNLSSNGVHGPHKFS